jgi:hypothetical protein
LFAVSLLPQCNLSNADIIYNLQSFHLIYGAADILFGDSHHYLSFMYIN